MPAWRDAEGAATFCADTEVGIRWAELEKEGEKEAQQRDEWRILGVWIKGLNLS